MTHSFPTRPSAVVRVTVRVMTVVGGRSALASSRPEEHTMRSSILLVFTLLLSGTLPVLAQSTAAQPPIEQAMTAEQFKAAGLDKLSPEELAHLNTWLDRTITTEPAKAAEQASVQTKERVESENRGFRT